MSIITNERIKCVAEKLYLSAYEASFGGKNRGRFLITRTDLRTLLGVSKLTLECINNLSEECLSEGIVLIDLEDSFGIIESSMIFNWRKIPNRIVEEYKDEIDSELDEDLEDYDDEDEE